MSNETILVFHGGLDTIGGNIISIVYDNYRIITDFGALAGVNYEELLDPESLHQLYTQQKIPQIKGIYPKDFLNDLRHVAELSYEDSRYETVVLISHLHLDHVGSLAQLHPDIPVYVSEEAYDFYYSLVQVEFLPEYRVNWQAVNLGEILKHGPFNIDFQLSDHDTPGASSIFIQAPDLKIIYSGDIRLTGFHPDRVLSMLQSAQEFEADLLLLEGTSYSHVDEEPSQLDVELAPFIEQLVTPTEKALMNVVDSLLQENNGKLFAWNGYPQNIQRLIHLAEVLNQHKRIFVLQPDLYTLVTPHIEHLDNVAPLKRELLPAIGVRLEDIKKNSRNYLLQVDEHSYESLFELPEGILLHSNGVPLGSYMPLYEKYVKNFDRYNWRFLNADVSGHASNADLLTIANLVDAKITIPWHTYKPAAFQQALQDYGIKAWRPEYHQQYTLGMISRLAEERKVYE